MTHTLDQFGSRIRCGSGLLTAKHGHQPYTPIGVGAVCATAVRGLSPHPLDQFGSRIRIGQRLNNCKRWVVQSRLLVCPLLLVSFLHWFLYWFFLGLVIINLFYDYISLSYMNIESLFLVSKFQSVIFRPLRLNILFPTLSVSMLKCLWDWLPHVELYSFSVCVVVPFLLLGLDHIFDFDPWVFPIVLFPLSHPDVHIVLIVVGVLWFHLGG